MAIELSEFSFDRRSLNLNPQTDFITKIPSRLGSKTDLLESPRKGLKFPAYFGNNWDALSDCLHDLSWLNRRRVAVLHDDLPALQPNELENYLDILSESVRSWKSGEDHELVVSFPQREHPKIEEFAKNEIGSAQTPKARAYK